MLPIAAAGRLGAAVQKAPETGIVVYYRGYLWGDLGLTPRSEQPYLAPMKRMRTDRGRAFGNSFVAGLASLGSFAHSHERAHPADSSSLAALQGDWSRIGRDMKRVIERENARIEKAKKSRSGQANS